MTKLCLGKTKNKFITFLILNCFVYTKIMFTSGFIWENVSQTKKEYVKKYLNNFFAICFLEPYVLTKNFRAFLTRVTRKP